MKLIDTRDAVGHMLCHDITQIIKGDKKGPVFRKGHIIREEDVDVLLSVGKDHIYIWEVNENMRQLCSMICVRMKISLKTRILKRERWNL